MPITVTGERRAVPGEVLGSRAWREAQTFGGYLPSDVSAGLLYGTDLRTVAAGGDMTHVTVGTGTLTLGTTPISNTLYWGRLKLARNGATGTGSTLNNVAIAGVRPDYVTPGDVHYLLATNDSDTSQFVANDILIDPFLWMRADAPGGPFTETAIREAYINSVGWKGGGGTLRNAKIAHCQDQWQGTISNTLDSAPQRFTLFEHCWLDTPLFYQGALWPSQPEGTHSDCAQPQQGARVTFRGGLMGGPTMPENSGSEGSCLTWKQEGTGAAEKQVDVEWDRVMFWSATAGNPNVNIVVANGNDFTDGCSMHDCLHVTRADNLYVQRNLTAAGHLDSTTNRKISDPTSGTWSDLGAINYTNG